jgi:hypothetical protein
VRVYLSGDNFLNEPAFWGRRVCWVLDLPFGRGFTCWGTKFLISLLAGAGLSAGFLSCSLGGGAPGRSTFSCQAFLFSLSEGLPVTG